MKRISSGVVVLVVAVFLLGCGPGGTKAPPLAKVKGTVNLDGKPMEGGEVRFNVTGQPPKVLEVKAGAFEGDVFTGKNRVDVVWDKDGPPHPMDPTQRLKVNVVSDKFSGPNSSLSHDIPTSGASDLKFDVTAKK